MHVYIYAYKSILTYIQHSHTYTHTHIYTHTHTHTHTYTPSRVVGRTNAQERVALASTSNTFNLALAHLLRGCVCVCVCACVCVCTSVLSLCNLVHATWLQHRQLWCNLAATQTIMMQLGCNTDISERNLALAPILWDHVCVCTWVHATWLQHRQLMMQLGCNTDNYWSNLAATQMLVHVTCCM